MVVRDGMLLASNALMRRFAVGSDRRAEPSAELQGELGTLLHGGCRGVEEQLRLDGRELVRLRFESLLVRRHGSPLAVSVAAQQILFEGSPAMLLTMLEHPTERSAWNGADGTFLEDVLEATPGATVVTHGGRVLYVNEEFARMFGYSQPEVVGCELDDLVVPEGRFHEIEMLEHELDEHGRATLETERRTRTGERLEVSVVVSRLRLGGEARGMFITYRDIREQKKEEARLLHSALHDALTGLPNRRLFLDRAELMLARLRRRPDRGFAIFFLDLDGFKRVNDELGHAAGDALLLEVASRLRRCVRPQDMVARFGGDEFAVLLDESGTDGELEALAMRVQQEICRPFRWLEHEAEVSASIGIAKAGQDTLAEEILGAADAAMYAAKRAGKRGFAVAPVEK